MIRPPIQFASDAGAIASAATSRHVSVRGLVDSLRKVGVFPALIFLLGGGLSLMAELPTGVGLAVCAPLFVASFRLPRSDFRLFVSYVLGFILFNGLRVLADNTGHGISYAYPIDLDRAVFGSVPTVWLQDHLYRSGSIRVVDSIAIAVYLSYFKAHFIAAALLWRFKRDLLETYVKIVLVTFGLGLIGYFLLPTAPPWMAAQAGDLPQVTRIFYVATDQLWHQANANGTYIAGTNDVGAMPSLHTALTMTIALIGWRINRFLGLLGFVYVALMAFSLVYMGEHYVADVIAGIVLAVVATKIVARLSERRSITGAHVRTQASEGALQEAA